YARELAMHDRTFVGNREVEERIRRHFNIGLADEAGPPQRVMKIAADDGRRDTVLGFLRQSLAEELHLKIERLDDDAAFLDMGLDFITGVNWMRPLNRHSRIRLIET